MDRQIGGVVFQVPYPGRKGWFLGASADKGEDVALRAGDPGIYTFIVRGSTDPRDDLAIQRNMDDLSGGPAQLEDLDRGIEQMRERIRARVEGSVWPDGRPEALDDEDHELQEEQLRKAWESAGRAGAEASDEEVRSAEQLAEWQRALTRMYNLREYTWALASWSVLRVTSPKHWIALDGLPGQSTKDAAARRGIREAIVSAYRATLGQEREGKTPS